MNLRLFEICWTERAENHKDRQYYQVCRSGCPTKCFVCVFWSCIRVFERGHVYICLREVMYTCVWERSCIHLFEVTILSLFLWFYQFRFSNCSENVVFLFSCYCSKTIYCKHSIFLYFSNFQDYLYMTSLKHM
jgi:hypothetical protein